MKPDIPHVPLEAGAGPENPPCPACGEPLFAWVGMPVSTGTAHRCEACGLGVLVREAGGSPGGNGSGPSTTFDPGTAADALAELDCDRGEGGSIRFESRASLQAALTGGAWSGLGTGHRYRFTPEAVRRLVAHRDQIVTKVRWLPGAGILALWQSGINMFTFGQNVALGSFGTAVRVPARRPWQRALDVFISVALAVPAIVISIPLELIAGLAGRGGACRAHVEVI